MKLEDIRSKINHMDFEITKLLNERMELSLRTKRLKSKVSDQQREIKVIKNVCHFSNGLIGQEFLKKLFNEIILESKQLQEKNNNLVGFQGEHGANSEIAAKKLDLNLIPIPCREFIDVMEGINSNNFAMGILPVENSLEGSINEVNDLLIIYDLVIIGEVNLPIKHCLLTLPETNHREIKIVYSHPQALAQCRGFISRNKLEPIPYYDTAGSAKMISQNRINGAAVIASQFCEKYYNLKIVKENIQDEETSYTRFIVLSKERGKSSGNKCSIIFSVKDEAGSLFKVLKIFSDHVINLTRIISRPQKNSPGNYIFLVDFQGSDQDEPVIKAQKKVKKEAQMYKFLGCYQEAIP